MCRMGRGCGRWSLKCRRRRNDETAKSGPSGLSVYTPVMAGPAGIRIPLLLCRRRPESVVQVIGEWQVAGISRGWHGGKTLLRSGRRRRQPPGREQRGRVATGVPQRTDTAKARQSDCDARPGKTGRGEARDAKQKPGCVHCNRAVRGVVTGLPPAPGALGWDKRRGGRWGKASADYSAQCSRKWAWGRLPG